MKTIGHESRLSRRKFLSSGTVGFSAGVHSFSRRAEAAVGSVRVPDKLAVLTFDDAVKSHRVMVAPFTDRLGLRSHFLRHSSMDSGSHEFHELAGCQ